MPGLNKKIKVAIIDFYAEGHHTEYLLNLARGLKRLNIKTLIMAPKNIIEQANSLGYETSVRSYELPPLQGLRRQFYCSFLCYKIINEAIAWGATHIHFLFADWHVAGIIAAWRIKKPVVKLVLTVHWSAGVGTKSGTFKDRVRRAPHRFALKKLKPHKLVTIVHHQNVAQTLKTSLGIKQVLVAPYPAGTLPSINLEDLLLFKECLGINHNDLIILCFGGTRYDKGADLAIEALSKLHPRYHLLIAGAPQYFKKETLMSIASKYGVGDRIHIIDHWLNEENISKVFHISDVVLFPYRKTFSGQSGPLIQAMSIGKSVVVPELPVLVETSLEYGMGASYPVENTEMMAAAIKTVGNYSVTESQKNTFISKHDFLTFSQAVSVAYLE